MRENIGLFKAKDIKTKEWREGYYWTNEVGNHFIRVIKDDFNNYVNPVDFEVNEQTLCECTGLKDKNGKLIFEGDEIYFLDGMSTENGFDDFNNTGFVKWSEEEARFYVTDRQSVSSEDALNYCTIIGNKFEEVESETSND